MAALPTEVVLVRAFLNTEDLGEGSDELSDVDRFAAWLREQGVDDPVTAVDLDEARRLRAALRQVLHDGVAGDGVGAAALREAAAGLPLRLVVDGSGAPVLEAVDGGARGLLERVVAGVSTASARGTWDRLKICPADECGWAFYDLSKNRSRRWCSMEVCGNRTKTRAYRARQG